MGGEDGLGEAAGTRGHGAGLGDAVAVVARSHRGGSGSTEGTLGRRVVHGRGARQGVLQRGRGVALGRRGVPLRDHMDGGLRERQTRGSR